MKKIWKIGLFALAVATGAVLGATTGSEETSAMPCCSSCDSSYTRCMQGCGSNATCQDNCLYKWESCSGYCSFSC
jgi:hypothetical protein